MLGRDQVPSSLREGGPPMIPPSTKRTEEFSKRVAIERAVLGLMALRSKKYSGLDRDWKAGLPQPVALMIRCAVATASRGGTIEMM